MCRWEQLRQGFLETNTINNYIDSLANYIEEARIRNFQRWPIIGVYVNWNGFVGQTYQEDLDYLKWYIEQRSLWLDANIPGSCVAGYEYEDNFVEEYHRAWPNPFTNDMYVGFTLFSSSDVRVEVRDLSGRIVEVQDLGQQNPGKHTVEFNDFSRNSGSYIYTVIGNEKPIYTGKIVKIN